MDPDRVPAFTGRLRSRIRVNRTHIIEVFTLFTRARGGLLVRRDWCEPGMMWQDEFVIAKDRKGLETILEPVVVRYLFSKRAQTLDPPMLLTIKLVWVRP